MYSFKKQHMRLIAYTLLLNSLLVFASFAQPQQFEPIQFDAFAEDGTRLEHAFTGGMEAPQFRPFLLNADGFEDLLVFDRVGAKLLPFVAEPQGGGNIIYRYAPALEAGLPADLNQLLLVTDLNCDGWADIVSTREETTAADVSLQAYLREPGFPLQFSAAQPLRQLTQGGQTAALHIHAYDVPVLKDLNGDERSDLLYIPIGGTHLQYYQQVGDCGALTFELADSCWGNASYTVEADFELQACTPGLRAQGCAGSVMFCHDYDNDGDQDLLFSGLYDEHILQLENAGSLSEAKLVSQDISWINEGMGLTRFPSPFFVPYSESQSKDLVVATNLITGQGYSSFNDKVLRFTLGSESDSWTLAEDQFLLDEMIDFGFRSNIALQDVNDDGRSDLLIGYNDRHPVFSYTASIALFINTGTAQQPAFRLQTTDWMGLAAYNFKSIAPAFGDFNGDGEEDLVVGLENGDLRLFFRQGDLFQLADGLALHELSLNGLARPAVIDYDRDGLLDLVCGTRDGTISYLENGGSPQAPAFTPVTDTLGGIYQSEGFYQECSVALAPKPENENGNWLYYGQRNGKVALYEINSLEEAQLVSPALPGIDFGERPAIRLADLNNNGSLELWSGNARGGVETLEVQMVNAAQEINNNTPLKIYPNPATRQAWLQLPENFQGGTLRTYNATGQQIASQYLQKGADQWRLPINHLSPGLYFYQITTKGERFTARLVVNH